MNFLFELNYAEAVSLVASERQTLRKIKSVTKRCIKRKGLVFRFDGLESYTNHCICIDAWSVEAVDESATSDICLWWHSSAPCIKSTLNRAV